MALGVTLTGWLLSLHVLSAFAVVGGLTVLLVALVAGRRLTTADAAAPLARVVRVGAAAFRGGLIGTAVLGVWLAFRIPGYSIWAAWILSSLILWLVMGGLGDRSIATFKRVLGAEGSGSPGEAVTRSLAAALRSPALLWLRVAAFAVAVVILVLMVWKPGA